MFLIYYIGDFVVWLGLWGMVLGAATAFAVWVVILVLRCQKKKGIASGR